MAELWSARWVMNASVLLNFAASILTPIAARIHYSLFITMRFVQGIGGVSIKNHYTNGLNSDILVIVTALARLQGVSFPAMHVMIAKWAPPNERSVIASIVYAGKLQNEASSKNMSQDASYALPCIFLSLINLESVLTGRECKDKTTFSTRF